MTPIASIQQAHRLATSQTDNARHAQLQALQRAGRISGLIKQPSFSLVQSPLNRLLPREWQYYIADFAYRDHGTGHYVLEDCRRPRAWAQEVKAWLVFWIYGIAVRQV